MEMTRYVPDLSAAELVEAIDALMYGQRCTDWLICRYLADLAEDDGYRAVAPGAPDIYCFARHKFGLSPKSCRERIRIGRALRTLPHIEEAFVTGEISYSRVREITRVADPASELFWLESAKRMTMPGLEQRVAHHKQGELPPERRPANKSWRTPEMVEVNMMMAPEIWAQLERAMGCVRAGAGRTLSDAEALEAIARAAISNHLESEEAPPPPSFPRRRESIRCSSATKVSRPTDAAVEPAADADEEACTEPEAPDGEEKRTKADESNDRPQEFAPDSVEAKILEVIGDRGGWCADRIITETGCETPAVLSALTTLVFGRAIQQDDCGFGPIPKKRVMTCPSWDTPPTRSKKPRPQSVRLGASLI